MATQHLDDLAKKYGRAYQCLRCLYRDGKEKIDVKRRIEGHIMKYHLSLDQVGHYCRLCSFRCSDRKTLEGHERTYKRHNKMALEQGVSPSDPSFLISNPSPYALGSADYAILSKERSVEYFRSRASKAKPKEAEDVLGSPDLEAFLETLAGLDDPIVAQPPQEEVPEKGSTTVDPEAPAQTEPLDLSVGQGSPAENILDQLLEATGPIDQPAVPVESEEPPLKRRRMEKAHQRKSRSPSPPPSPASSTSSSTSTSSSMTPDQWRDIAVAALAPLIEAVHSNTRAIRCLGQDLKTVLNQQKRDGKNIGTQTDSRDSRDNRESRVHHRVDTRVVRRDDRRHRR